jgi:hypothetical protein
VVWGRGETAAICCPTKVLIKVDLPTLVLPITETNPERNDEVENSVMVYSF